MKQHKGITESSLPPDRILSVDFFRGITMFLLIGEFTGIFSFLASPEFGNGVFHSLAIQFEHHPWHGLRFWDLIQPFFMFIVGVAIPFSVMARKRKGHSQREIRMHAIKRSLILLFAGWFLYCIPEGRIVFYLQNVLAQLSVTYLVAFFLMDQKNSVQLFITLAILLFMDLAYRYFPVDGFNQAFEPAKNLGAWVDLKIAGKLSWGNWVSLNAIPTIAHTVWGVMVGKLLLSEKSAMYKLRVLVIAGIIALAGGFLLDPITPIIKRISTSSFVLASGGWSLLAMALSYWMIDILNIRKPVMFFSIVGMNPLFIYLFAHVGGSDLVSAVFRPLSNTVFGEGSPLFAGILTAILSWGFLWYICYWLHSKKIYIRI